MEVAEIRAVLSATEETHELILESNRSPRTKCRSTACLFEGEERFDGDYRVSLRPIRAISRESDFRYRTKCKYFHFSCFASMDNDLLEEHIQLDRPESQWYFGTLCYGAKRICHHHALVDWFDNGHKAYNAEVYDDFDAAFALWERVKSDLWIDVQRCKHPVDLAQLAIPRQPRLEEFATSPRAEKSLIEVLVDVLSIGHQRQTTCQQQLAILEGKHVCDGGCDENKTYTRRDVD